MIRRDFLKTAWGFAAAQLACKFRPPARRSLPPGAVVGINEELGHALRDGERPEPTDWEETRLLIVGGGVAGLSAAWRLQRAGFEDFRLIELESFLGGTSRRGVGAVSPFPWGAHYLPAPTRENPSLLRLLDEMGIMEGRDSDGQPIFGEQFLVRTPEERIFYKGRWYEGLYLRAGMSAEDERQWEVFHDAIDHWTRYRDAQGRRAFSLPIVQGSRHPEVLELDKLSMAQWLDQQGFTSPRLRWYVDYACRDDYGSKMEHTSAWAGLFYFCSRMKAPGVEAEPLLTWPEGNGYLVHHLQKQVRSRISTGLAATNVRNLAKGVQVSTLRGHDRKALGFRARKAILAVPQFVAGQIMESFREHPPEHLKSFEYGAWFICNLHLRDRPREDSFPLAWDNVLYESEGLGYVVATHQTGQDHGPVVLTYYHPLCDEDPKEALYRLLALEREAAAEICLQDLSRAHPELWDLVERLDVNKMGHAMVRSKPGLFSSGALEQARMPRGHIHFACSDLSGLTLFEEAFYHGLRAAEEAMKELKHPFQSWL